MAPSSLANGAIECGAVRELRLARRVESTYYLGSAHTKVETICSLIR